MPSVFETKIKKTFKLTIVTYLGNNVLKKYGTEGTGSPWITYMRTKVAVALSISTLFNLVSKILEEITPFSRENVFTKPSERDMKHTIIWFQYFPKDHIFNRS